MYSRAGRTVSHRMHVCVPIVKGGGYEGTRRGRTDVIEYVISASFDGGKLYPCRGANPEFTVRIISQGRLTRFAALLPFSIVTSFPIIFRE